jgi:apolipoprotein D and lipocalin family protein
MEETTCLKSCPMWNWRSILENGMRLLTFPPSFRKAVMKQQQPYTLLKDGNISVLNTCKRNCKVKTAKGKAKVVDEATGAKLKVTFFWPFYGDYWIIKLGMDYEYAVVGTPNLKYLWILSRTPRIDNKLFSELTEFAKSKGFDTNRLIITKQPQTTP